MRRISYERTIAVCKVCGSDDEHATCGDHFMDVTPRTPVVLRGVLELPEQDTKSAPTSDRGGK